MKRYSMKRAAAAAAAAVMAVSASGCSSSTDYSMTANGKKINAGVYIYYIFSEMSNQMSELYYSGEITEAAEVFDKQVDGKDFKVYVKDAALDDTKELAAVQAKFEEFGLSLSEDDAQLIEDSVSSSWSSLKDFLELEGISRESYKLCTEHDYKKDAIFEHYYGEEGVEAVTDDDVQQYVNDNYVRYKMLSIPKSSKEDQTEAAAENEELKTLWEGYIAEAEGLSFADFDTILNEYSEYAAEKQAQEEAEAALESGDLDLSDAIGLDIDDGTAEDTDPDAEENAGDDIDPDIEGEETVVEGETETAEAGAEEDTESETVSADEDGAAEDTEADGAETSDESEETAEESADTEETEESTEDDSSAEDGESTDTDEEAADDETAEDDEDEEPDPYENERVLNFTQVTDPEYTYYDEDFAGMLTDIKNNGYDKIGSKETNDYYYIYMAADVSERTDYTEDNRDTLVHNMKDDEFDGLVTGWIDACSIVVNEKAVKRYTVQEVYDRQDEYTKSNA